MFHLEIQVYHRCVCMYKKHSICRVWYYLRFQASLGGLGMYPPRIRGVMQHWSCHCHWGQFSLLELPGRRGRIEISLIIATLACNTWFCMHLKPGFITADFKCSRPHMSPHHASKLFSDNVKLRMQLT